MRFSRSASPVLLFRALGILFSFAASPILARSLGPAARGEAAAAITIMITLPIVLSLGIPVVVRRAFAIADDPGARALRTARIFAIAAGVAAIPLALIATSALFPAMTEDARIAFLIATPISAVSGFLWILNANTLVGRGSTFGYALVSVTPTVIYSVALGTLWALGLLTLSTALLAQGFSYLLNVVVSGALVRVPLRGPRVSMRSLAKDGAKYAGSQIAEAASYRLDQVLALPLLGASQAGLYAVASTISLLPSLAGQAIAASAFRQATKHAQAGTVSNEAVLIRASLLVGVIFAVPLGLVTPIALPLIFGQEYSASIPAVFFGLLGAIAITATLASGTLLVARNFGWRLSIAQICGVAVGVTLLFILRGLGSNGAAIASSAGYITSAVVTIAALRVPFRSLAPQRRDFHSIFTLFTKGYL